MRQVDELEPGLRVLAEVIQAVADRERHHRFTVAPVEETDVTNDAGVPVT